MARSVSFPATIEFVNDYISRQCLTGSFSIEYKPSHDMWYSFFIITERYLHIKDIIKHDKNIFLDINDTNKSVFRKWINHVNDCKLQLNVYFNDYLCW